MARCLICHRKLRDQESIDRKIGPTCFSRLRKLNLEEKTKKKARKAESKRKAEIIKNQISIEEYFEEVETDGL